MCAIEQCAPWDVVHDTQPRAHQAHQCTECSRTIRRGETYRKIHGLCDGYWATHKICAHCDAAAQWMMVVCDGYPLNSLYDELLEHWRDGFRSAGLFRLIVGMRRRWHDGRDPVPTGVGALARQMLGQVAA
jgi:hypothetical protein